MPLRVSGEMLNAVECAFASCWLGFRFTLSWLGFAWIRLT